MTFDVIAAAVAASKVVYDREQEVILRAGREGHEARNVAREYAEQLAGAGDPLDYPDNRGVVRGGQAGYLVNPFDALRAVYDVWNTARGSRNPIWPFRQHREWRVGEAFAASIGTPISYADLADVYRGGSSVRPSSETIAGLALRFENHPSDDAAELGHDLVARKTKINGKVGYLVRERRPDDPPAGSYRASSLPEEAS